MHAAGSWLTVNVRPPAVIEPLLAAPAFASTRYVTVPVPVPEAPPVTVIQPAFDVAVQAHPAAVWTWNVWPLAPEAGAVAPVGDRR